VGNTIYTDSSKNILTRKSNLQIILPETEAFDTRCIRAFMSETALSPRLRDT